MRVVLGIVAGFVVAVACVFAIEAVSHVLFPPPPDMNVLDPAQMERLMATMPMAALGFVMVAWFVGSLAGAWVAIAVARRALAGWVVALLVVCGGIWTMTTIPHPAWMWAGGILLPLLAGWLAQRFTSVPA